MSQYLQFNPSRFWLLFVREVREQTLQWRLWILLSMVMAILGYLASYKSEHRAEDLINDLFFIINIGGCIFTSSIFKEWNDHSKTRYFCLTLPVSRLEVLLVKWFISGIGFSLAITGLYILMCEITAGISGLFYPSGHYIVPITVLLMMWLKLLCNYLLLHAVFFFGAVVFTPYRFFKSLLVLSGFLLVVILTLLVTSLPSGGIQLSFPPLKLTFLDPEVYVSGSTQVSSTPPLDGTNSGNVTTRTVTTTSVTTRNVTTWKLKISGNAPSSTQVSSTLPHDCTNSGNITTRMVNVLDWFRWLLIPSVLILTYHRLGKLED